MGYKIDRAVKKSTKSFIIGIVLWIIISIAFIVPLAVTIVNVSNNEDIHFNDSVNEFLRIAGDVTDNFKKVFTKEYIKTFEKCELWLGIIILFFATIGFIKAIPKNEYTDIEHGSSDWAKGEEYKVLSKRKGIILAEKHYLPVNKRGNVNVLVVGRFRFW